MSFKLDRNNGVTIFRRFCHPGPLLSLFIIMSVTIQTLYLNSMWFPPNLSPLAFLHQFVFIILSTMTLLNFSLAAVLGPGYLPIGWKPKNKKHENYLQKCAVCPETYKAPRAHHCRKCNRCVTKMDHHCVYLNNCVGHANHTHFIWFLLFAVLGCFHATIILISSLYAGLYRDYFVYYQQYQRATVRLTTWSLIFTVFNIGLAIGVIIAVGMLLFFQLKSILRNRTGIEDWIFEKAVYRRQALARRMKEAGNEEFQVDEFVYPYDLGRKKNLLNVMSFNCVPIGDGVSWDVVSACDQFTLTKEQLAQKMEKRARTRRYQIISKVTGSWMPLWSQGCKVCAHPPLTDEARIALDVDDFVNVTRWRKHWLFGEKIQNLDILENVNNAKSNGNGKNVTSDINSQTAPKRVRGWFPRQCAVENFGDNDDYSDEDDGIDCTIKKRN